ncbi:hypothetical protein E1265_21295 [Streptomyces sp. 8K308]|uniref:hypothetical protein n=1 Tax=Streptomyces sp. 8K308 TaxID=2530388 RepID=UPI0010495657|nr:hypothetical protein [Streptomyces sp. 8K308]TDC20608.1 hypothetical protein E1265_21295 [Streptomyces sp. 8K308]
MSDTTTTADGEWMRAYVDGKAALLLVQLEEAGVELDNVRLTAHAITAGTITAIMGEMAAHLSHD